MKKLKVLALFTILTMMLAVLAIAYLKGDTVEIDGWVLPGGLPIFLDCGGYRIYGNVYSEPFIFYYFPNPNPDRPFAFVIQVSLESDSLEQDIVLAREILAQRFSDSQVDQIMDRLEYALITKRNVRGLEQETVVFNNIKVDTMNLDNNKGVFIAVWLKGYQQQVDLLDKRNTYFKQPCLAKEVQLALVNKC